MNYSDLFEETIFALLSNKVRSGLTILGIVIGIGSVIAMLSIGQGAQNSIQSSIQSIGSNLIIVIPGFQRTGGVSAGRGSATTLTQADADAIKTEITSAVAVAPDITRRYQVVVKGQNTNTQVVGTVAAYSQVRKFDVASGSFITDDEVRSLARVAVIGPTTSDDLFGTSSDPIGQNIRIKGIDFRVIGVTVSKGGTGFTNQDDIVIVPITTAQRLLEGDTYVSTISVQAPDQASMAGIQQQITDLLLQRHKISNPANADFSVLNQSDIVATASSVTNTFTIFLASVAGISLLVGGIGIMNMMLTTVTERTREIGLRKAIGAKKKDINLQFLTEAVMLTFLGGFMGVVLGLILSYVVGQVASTPTQVSVTSVLLAFGVSAIIGIVFGYYPAKRASKLNPIEALRYE